MNTTTELLAPNSSHQAWLPLLEVAAQEVFELMLNCRLTMPQAPMEGVRDITSMVGFAGKLCGVFSIQCSYKSAELMASKMLGVEPDKVGAEVCDAFGEVCNMVAGNFKNKISGLGTGCMLSVPTVITGTDYRLHSVTGPGPLEVALLFENLPMVISLQIHS
jgi:chemotaxis protein CheX